MADSTLSLRLDDLLDPPAARGFLRAAPPTKVAITLLDKKRKPIGDAFTLDVPKPVWVEAPSEGGAFDWSAVRPPLSLPAAKGAAFVHAAAGGATREFAFAALRSAKPKAPDARRSFGSATGWKLLILSEMFSDATRFFDACTQLFDFVAARPPFNETAVKARFGIEALFWKSGPGGLFKTEFKSEVPDDRRCFGDAAIVRKFVKKADVRGNKVLVLIDSNRRGGAGGVQDSPAWSTIADLAGESWEQIALHELGHSLGLADEYVANGPGGPEPAALEPNVTRERDATKAPWRDLRTRIEPHDPTCPAGGAPPVGAGIVGTFEGARYLAANRYRPSFDCLMNHTNAPFCAVCRREIRKAIAAA